MPVVFNALPVMAMLDDIQRRQLPFAHSLALTNTALFARGQVINEMRRQFDRPKPQTVNEKTGPLRVKTANRRLYPNDYSEVRVKDFARANSDPALVWLSPAIRGNTRIEKRSEILMRNAGILPPGHFAVPGSGAELDQYGNMKRTQMHQVLTALGGRRNGLTNTKGKTLKSAYKAQRKATIGNSTYFVAQEDSHLPPGIWQRKAGRALVAIMIFVKSAPRYRKRIRWEELAQQTGLMRFPIEFHLGMRQAMATARVVVNPLVR